MTALLDGFRTRACGRGRKMSDMSSDATTVTVDTDDDNELVRLFKRRQHNAALRSLLAAADGLAAFAAGDNEAAVECFVISVKERALADAYGPEIEAAKSPP